MTTATLGYEKKPAGLNRFANRRFLLSVFFAKCLFLLRETHKPGLLIYKKTRNPLLFSRGSVCRFLVFS